jgi:hypothetical protein
MGKRALQAGVVVLLVVLFTGVLILGGGGSGQNACAAVTANTTAAETANAVEGYSGDQLVNAAAIMNAGAALGVNAKGQTIAVMTAMGESTLRNITYGDTAGPDSRGLFQQRDTWGTLAERMNPTKAATFFYERLVKVPNWETLAPTEAAHRVQINADPNHYTRFYDAAERVVTTLAGGGDAACASTSVGGNAQELAKGLTEKIDEGKITGLSPDHLREIRWIAEGRVVPNCGIDTRILQVITITTNTFEQVGISDINRLCTGQRPGAGNASMHVVNGGGHAVDYYSLDRVPVTGADANSMKLIKILDPLMADGSGFGQSQCRAAAGLTFPMQSAEFLDGCNHFHVQVDGNGNQPMKLAADS